MILKYNIEYEKVVATNERQTQIEKQLNLGPRFEPPKPKPGWTVDNCPEDYVDPITPENDPFGDKWRDRKKTQDMLLEDYPGERAAYLGVDGPLVTRPWFKARYAGWPPPHGKGVYETTDYDIDPATNHITRKPQEEIDARLAREALEPQVPKVEPDTWEHRQAQRTLRERAAREAREKAERERFGTNGVGWVAPPD